MIAWIHSGGWELYVFHCAVSLDRVTWYKQEVVYSVYSGGLTFTSYYCSLRNWWHAQLLVGKGISSFIVVLSRVFFFFISRVCVCVCVYAFVFCLLLAEFLIKWVDFLFSISLISRKAWNHLIHSVWCWRFTLGLCPRHHTLAVLGTMPCGSTFHNSAGGEGLRGSSGIICIGGLTHKELLC